MTILWMESKVYYINHIFLILLQTSETLSKKKTPPTRFGIWKPPNFSIMRMNEKEAPKMQQAEGGFTVLPREHLACETIQRS